LDRPALFENRVCYRLLDAIWTARPDPAGRGCDSAVRYFDAVNLGAAVRTS